MVVLPVKYLHISVRNGFIWIGVGLLFLLIGVGIAMGDVGTREHPFRGAIGLATILVAIAMIVWGIVQILATWGENRDAE